MDNLITLHEVAKMIDRTMPTVYGLANEKGFPEPAAIIGKTHRVWNKRDILAWIKARNAKRSKRAA